jgi:hypothetical protein
MSPAEIIERATEEGVLLALSPSGSISAKGDQSAVDRWLPAIKQSKAAIIAELQLEQRRAKVLAMLRDNLGIRYAIEVADANTDPVIVSIGIRNVGACPFQRHEARHSFPAGGIGARRSCRV